MVHHQGRRSRATYTTPVNAFSFGDSVIVALTYGPSADWVRNVLAGPAQLEVRSGKRPIIEAVVVDRSEAASALPWLPRVATRILGVADFLQIRTEDRS